MKTDVAILGSGPAGSSAAMHLARHGIDSVIVEKMRFLGITSASRSRARPAVSFAH